MNRSNLLVLSLLLNGCLLAAVAYVAAPRPTAQVVGADAEAPEGAATRTKARRAAAPTPRVVAPAEASFTWTALESPDYRLYISNLRSVGCPEETIRDIIVADVQKLYAARIAALHRELSPPSDYWRGMDTHGARIIEFRRQTSALEREMRELLKELLGVDLAKERAMLHGFPDHMERMYPFLSEEKREQIRALDTRHGELMSEAQGKFRGYWGEEFSLEMRRLAQAKREELARILTPPELDEYELRTSANSMQHQMRWFEPSEHEFRQLFKIQQAFQDATPAWLDADDKEAQARYKAAQTQRDEAIKAQLGEARFTDYQRANDHSYQQLSSMVSRAGLPRDTASKVYDMKAAAEQQARLIRSEQSRPLEERKELLKAIQAETQRAVTEALGEKTYKSYKTRHGWWIDSLGR